MKLDEMVKGFEKRLEYAKTHYTRKSKVLYVECMKNHFERIANAQRMGKPMAWISALHPVELLYSMDIVPFPFEQYTLQMLAAGDGLQYFDVGSGYGYPKEACSLHLATVGAIKSGLFDPPDMILGTAVCGSIGMMNEVLYHMLKIPTHFLSLPYRHDEEAVEHFKAELEDMVHFVEENTGHQLDYDKLGEKVENAKKAFDYSLKINELRKKVPCPLNSREATNAFPLRQTNEGFPEQVQYFEALYQEVKERGDKGEGCIPEEKYRLITLGTMPFWHMRLLDWLEEKYKAVIVATLGNSGPQIGLGDTSDPLRCIAEKFLLTSSMGLWLFCQPFNLTMKAMAKTAEEAKVNAAIFFANFGCKIGCGTQKIFVDKLKELGIPTLILDMDATNPAVVSLNQLEAKINEYFTMLDR